MREAELKESWKAAGGLSHASLIRVIGCIQSGGPVGELAVVIGLGENLAPNWLSGDAISFWGFGEHLALDGLEFEVLVPDLFRVLKPGDPRTPMTVEEVDELLTVCLQGRLPQTTIYRMMATLAEWKSHYAGRLRVREEIVKQRDRALKAEKALKEARAENKRLRNRPPRIVYRNGDDPGV